MSNMRLDPEKLKNLSTPSPTLAYVLSAIPVNSDWEHLPQVAHLLKVEEPERKSLEEIQKEFNDSMDRLESIYLNASRARKEESLRKYNTRMDSISQRLKYWDIPYAIATLIPHSGLNGTTIAVGHGSITPNTPSVEVNWFGKVLLKLTGFRLSIK